MGLVINAEIECNRCNVVQPLRLSVDNLEGLRNEAEKLGWSQWAHVRFGTIVDLCPEMKMMIMRSPF